MDYGSEGFGQVHDVQPDGPVVDVPGVHGYALGVCGVAAAAGLPHAGDAGQDAAVFFEVLAIAWDFFFQDRPWAYEAHVAFDDVPELREFVETGLSEEGAELRYSGVVCEFEGFFPFFPGLGMGFQVLFEFRLGIWNHGLEFVAVEFFAVIADAAMGEEHMAVVPDGVRYGYGQQDRADEQAAADGGYQVKRAFVDAITTPGQVVFQREHHDLLIVEHLGLYAAHRCSDEVRDEGDVADQGLDFFYEAGQLVLLEARGADDDLLDPGVFDNLGGLIHVAVEQESLAHKV